MIEWQPIEAAPKDGRLVRLQLANGCETYGEYWAPPPREIDPEQTFGGWAIDCMLLGLEPDKIDSEPTHWAPVDA